MRKSLIILTLLLVVIASVTLTACGNTPLQTLMELPWGDKVETATYKVSYKKNKVEKEGELVVTYRVYENQPLNVNDEFIVAKGITTKHITPSFKSKKFSGAIITTDLKVGDEYKHSVAITNKQLVPRYSFTVSNFNDVKDASKVNYIENEYKYGATSVSYNVKGSIKKSGSIKYKEFNRVAYFDNAFYITLNRAMTHLGTMNQQKQLSFLTPSYDLEKMMKRVATNTGNKLEVKPLPELGADKFVHQKDKKDKTTVTCYRSVIASGETMPGSGAPILYDYAAVPYMVGETKVKNILLKFVEHDTVYELKSYTIA